MPRWGVGTDVDGHVEVVGLEGVGHLAETLQGVLPRRLLEAKSLRRSLAFLGGRDKGFGVGVSDPKEGARVPPSPVEGRK